MHHDGHGSILRQLVRPALSSGALSPPALRQIHLVIEAKHGRVERILLRRVEAIAVVCGVLGRVMRTDLEDIDQDADMLEDRRRRALGG